MTSLGLYERDLCHLSAYPKSRFIRNQDVRGRFPKYFVWGLEELKNYREVPGAFVNLTKLEVPEKVKAFLSYGPKFMLPSYTLHSAEYKLAEWDALIYELEESGYVDASYKIGQVDLSSAFQEHMGDDNRVFKRDLRVFSLAYITDKFLQKHKKTVILVEGDKGKKIGLMYRDGFMSLCDKYISDNVKKGNYVEFSIEDEATYISEIRKQYEEIVAPYLLEYSCDEMRVKRIFIPDINKLLSNSHIKGCNAFIRANLRRVEWKIPVLQPTIKFHKDPVKIRPVICKRGTPSISVGKVIKFTIEQIM